MGIEIEHGSTNRLESNLLLTNKHGIFVRDSDQYHPSQNYIIQNNVVIGSQRHGIWVRDSHQVEISGNKVSGNGWNAIRACGPNGDEVYCLNGPESGIRVFHNEILVPTPRLPDLTWGILARSPVDARDNWWGTVEPDDIAALISGPVSFEPFLRVPVFTPDSGTAPPPANCTFK